MAIKKKCTRCLQNKDLNEFHKTNQIKSGYSSWCETCYREYHHGYYKKHEPTIKDRADKFYSKNKERLIVTNKAWAKENIAKVRVYKKSWKSKNPEKTREANNACKKRHPETSKVHNQNRRARLHGCTGKITKREWLDLVKQYNHTCLRCLLREPNIKLTLDHVIPISLGGANEISNAQPLCKPCNSSKGTQCTDYRPAFQSQWI